jgi:formiminotetrahydrofolate cyclodeaminase
MNATQLTCRDFVDALASSQAAPGGGGTAALCGALGTALGSMVGALTVGKPKYAAVDANMRELMEQAAALQERLLDLVAKDAEVFVPLAAAYGMPTETSEQRAEKAAVMERHLRACAEVPLDIMRACAQAIDLQQQFAAMGSALALSDAGCGAVICRAALEAAALNVYVNTKLMQDEQYAGYLNSEAAQLLDLYTRKANALYAQIKEKLTRNSMSPRARRGV